MNPPLKPTELDMVRSVFMKAKEEKMPNSNLSSAGRPIWPRSV